MMTKRNNVADIVAICVLILYFAEQIFPVVSGLGARFLVSMVCLTIWFICAFFTDINLFQKKSTLGTIIIFVIMILLPYVFGYPVIAHRYANLALTILGTIIFDYYRRNNIKALRVIVAVTVILSGITMVITYRALLVNAYISRSIKSSGEYSAALAKQGIGGYGIIYYVAAVSPIVLFYALACKGKVKKIALGCAYVFCLMFILKANYMTAFVVVLTCGAIVVMLCAFSFDAKGKILALFLLGIVIALIVNMNAIFSMLSFWLPPRLSRVLSTQTDQSPLTLIIQEFVEDRWPPIMTSINAFLEHPIGGIMGSGTLQYVGNELTGFGQHSYVMDTFALYGFIPGILLLIALLRPFRLRFDKRIRPLKLAMLVSMLMLYFCNNGTDSIGMVYTIYYPAVAYVLYDQGHEEKSNG